MIIYYTIYGITRKLNIVSSIFYTRNCHPKYLILSSWISGVYHFILVFVFLLANKNKSQFSNKYYIY